MNNKYENIQWLIQRNLTSMDDLELLRFSCNKLGIRSMEIDIIPFSYKLPPFDDKRKSIIYGSTTFNNLAYKDPVLKKGVFFNKEKFSIENYLGKWGRHMLNYSASILTFKDLIESKMYDDEKLLFIRPDDDSKSFSGEVKQFSDIEKWYQSLKEIENVDLSLESKIVVSEPYNIKYEWRLWIVNKKVVAASKYREYFKLKKERGCPTEIILFAEQRCQEYTPHDVFVMDVCLSGDEFYIVECGCMNGAGFYKADIESIVKNVSDYFLALS